MSLVQVGEVPAEGAPDAGFPCERQEPIREGATDLAVEAVR